MCVRERESVSVCECVCPCACLPVPLSSRGFAQGPVTIYEEMNYMKEMTKQERLKAEVMVRPDLDVGPPGGCPCAIFWGTQQFLHPQPRPP